MIRRVLVLMTLAATAIAGIGSTGASFTATQQNGANRYDGKADWVAPAVTLTDPGANLRGTVSVGASSSDSGSGVQSVTIQRSPAGAASWTTICNTTISPYSCSLNTTAGATADGLYDFRATAVDNAGNVGTSATVASRRIDNTAPAGVTMTDPGSVLSGTAAFSGAATDTGGSGIASVRFQYRLSSGGSWVDACSALSSPYGCSFVTTTATDGLYDFQALATDNAGNTTTSSIYTSRRIDNTAPAVTFTDPGTGPYSGTKALSATSTDTGGSGVASVRFQYRPSSGGLWLDACTDPSSPYSCSLDTSTLTDGTYDFQALATDNAGNTTASTVYTSRRVDNVAPTVTMNDPGQYLKGTVSLTAAASDGGGIANVVIQRRPNGTSTWTTVCTATVSVYTCPLTTSSLTDGLYDFQAIATDNASRSTTSSIVLARQVDNTAPASVTVTNPGASVSGTKALTGSGTDGGSGIATIALQYSPTGANTWTTACSGTTSTTTCNFDTTTITDGLYDFRTQATDRAGNVANSATASPNSRVDNYFPTVAVTDPGLYLKGTVTFTATAADGGGIASVQIQYKTSAGSTWSSLCTATAAPYQCSIATTGGADGNYDFRAIATDNAGKATTSTTITNRVVDNAAPSSATFTNPGSPLKGTVAFAGAATDATSGIDTVQFQYLNGATWTTICSASSAPYGCNGDTTTIADGSYTMRSLATDHAGNTLASTTVASRVIDNTAPLVTMGDPGALRGTATLSATASDGSGSGVASVKIQYKPSAGSTWTDICTDNLAPFTCSLDTTTLTEGGNYDFRAIATDGAAWTTTSAVVGPRTVDNTAPTITMTNPGSPISGSVALASSPADGGSGIASVTYQYKLSSGSTWTTACTGSSSPWGCSWASTGVSDDSYDLRAIATDAAGNQTTSAAITARIVDNNTAPVGTDVQAANGGATAGVLEVNDSITFTFSEPVAPGSILSGWTGASAATVVVRVDNNTGTGLDRLSVWNSSDNAITNLVSDPTTGGVRLFGDYVPSGGAKFNASMTMTGSTIKVTFTSLRSGSVQSTAVGLVNMSWLPSAGATDLAGHALGTAAVAESGASDRDF